MLFPKTTMRASSFLTALALNGKYWAAAPLNRFSQSNIFYWPRPEFTPRWHGFEWHDLPFYWLTQKFNNLYEELILDLNLNAEFVDEQSFLLHELNAYAWARRQMKVQTDKTSAEFEEELKAWQQSKGSGRTEPGPEPSAGSLLEAHISKMSIRLQDPAKEEVITPHTVLGEAEAPQKNSKASFGHIIVLKMCLRLLWEPDKLDQWFLEASPGGQGALRCFILEQIKEVDQWLRENQADVECRSAMLGNTTIVLLKIEQMIENGSLHKTQPEASLGYFGWGQSAKRNPGKSTEREQQRETTAREIHSDTLLVLHNLVDHLGEDHPEARKVASLMEVHEAFPSSRLWDRLSTLASYHSEEELPFWDRLRKERDNKMARDIDDVIIYRCLMMILLFRTATDSSKILESGLWDKVVPMI